MRKLFQCVGILVSMFLVDRFGRKGLLLISTFVSALCLFTLGTYFYLDENKCLENGSMVHCNTGFRMELVDNLKWMPVVRKNCHHGDYFQEDLSKLLLAGVNCAIHLHLQYWYWPSTMDYDWRALP